MRFSKLVLITLVFHILSPYARAQNAQEKAAADRLTQTEERLRQAEQRVLAAEEKLRKESGQDDWETKIFPIRYVDPNELTRVLSMFRSNVSYSGGALRILSVRAPKEIMPAIEDTIKKLDVPMPRKDAELMIYVLMASDQANTAPLPSALQPVVNQLRNVLSYKGYQLVDTLIARGREGTGTNLGGILPVELGNFPGNITYNFRAGFRVVNPDGKDSLLRLEGMRFVLTVPINVQGQTMNLDINTDVDIPRGQQVVVGKASYKDRAFILVMNARFD